MRRREVIRLLGGAAAWPLAARAQQPALPVVGFLSSGSADAGTSRAVAFRKGLGETGYVEGQNVMVEYHWLEGQNDRLLAMAVDLVHRQVTVITVIGVTAALAVKRATTTIPIVFQTGVDPVGNGLVASLNRPSGNVTGVTTLGGEVAPKRLELMHELLPTTNVMAHLVNPTDPYAETEIRGLQATARILGLQLHVLRASAERDFDTVFATLAELRAGALVIGGDVFLISRSEELAVLALRHAVPTIFQYREFAAAGGLMSYGGSITDADRLVGVYVGRILKGEKPADLPVQQGTKVVLTINMKTAKALGLAVPITLLGRADEVIE